MPKRVLVMVRKSPYGTVYPAEALRAMMGLAAFEVEVEVLLIHDGVFLAMKDHLQQLVEQQI